MNLSIRYQKSLKSAIRGLSRDVLVRTAETVAAATLFAAESTGFDGVLFAGGVSSSAFLRKELTGRLKGLTVAFGEPSLSADNAVGTGLLGLAAFKNDNVLRNGAADAMMREGE